MSRPDRRDIERKIPQAGDIAWFHDLDLDTLRDRRPSQQRSTSFSYTVDGKVRKMYVLSVLWKEKKRFFCVVPITHSGKDGRGADRTDRIHIGKCVTEGDDKPSFFRLPAEELREGLLCREDGRSPVVRACDPLGFGCAIRLLQFKLAQEEQQDSGQ